MDRLRTSLQAACDQHHARIDEAEAAVLAAGRQPEAKTRAKRARQDRQYQFAAKRYQRVLADLGPHAEALRALCDQHGIAFYTTAASKVSS